MSREAIVLSVEEMAKRFPELCGETIHVLERNRDGSFAEYRLEDEAVALLFIGAGRK